MNKVGHIPLDIDLDDPRFRIKPYQQIMASCTGALITSLFAHASSVSHHLMVSTGVNGKWGKIGVADALLKISRREGVLSLWSGLSPTLVLAVPATIVYFVSYEQLRLYFKDTYNLRIRKEMGSKEQPFWIPMLAGSTARVWAATLVSPLELIRTKMQSQQLSYGEIRQALKTVVKYNGVPALWMGLSSTLLRDVPFSAIYWLNYETLKQIFGGQQQSFTFNLLAGAVAGSIAAVFTIPFDVVKTHRQIEMGEKTIYSDKPGQSSKTWHIIQRIYSQSGVKGLFTGLTPRLVKVAPACAIMIATFEHGKRFFQSYNAYHVLQLENDVHCLEHKRTID